MSLRAAVVVASNRAASGVYADETGPLIADWLRDQGFDCAEPVLRHAVEQVVGSDH